MALRMNRAAGGDQHKEVLEPLRLKIPPINRVACISRTRSVIMHSINHELAGRLSEMAITVKLVTAIE